MANNVTEAEAVMSSTVVSSELLYFSQRGSGPPLLLVHGLISSRGMIKRLEKPAFEIT